MARNRHDYAARLALYGVLAAALITGILSPVVQTWLLRKKEPKIPPPLAPSGLTIVTFGTVLPFEVYEKPVPASRLRTPCTATSKSGRVYSFAELSAMPQVPSLNRPWLLAKPLHLETQPSPASDQDYDLMLEVSVTNRGEPSVAKDWELCLDDGDFAFRYSPAGNISRLGRQGFACGCHFPESR